MPGHRKTLNCPAECPYKLLAHVSGSITERIDLLASAVNSKLNVQSSSVQRVVLTANTPTRTE